MSDFEFRLPDIGEGVAEGEIVEWHVSPGDIVGEDEPIVEITTDKASVTIGAPRAGTIKDLRFAVGTVAQVGDVILVINTAGDGSTVTVEEQAATKESATDEGPAATAVGDIREGLPGSSFFQSAKPAKQAAAPAQPAAAAAVPASRAPAPVDFFQAKPLATPATRKLARDLEVDLRRVPPTGPGGRVTKADVRSVAGGGASVAAPSGATTSHAPVALERQSAERETRQPFVGIRRKIAARMQQSKNTAAHFTFVEECDVGRLKDVRSRLKAVAAEQDVKLTFLPFIAKAVIAALAKHPILNSALDESSNELVYRNYVNLGIAAATEKGLMVPVIRDAERLSILDLAKEIARVGEGARTGTLGPSELQGSTFTITSLGKQGGLFATPVLNFPEVGILGVHQIKQKPVVRNGEIVVGDVMLLSLSFDHRIVDGHVGAAFAYDIISYLEEPERLLLELS